MFIKLLTNYVFSISDYVQKLIFLTWWRQKGCSNTPLPPIPITLFPWGWGGRKLKSLQNSWPAATGSGGQWRLRRSTRFNSPRMSKTLLQTTHVTGHCASTFNCLFDKAYHDPRRRNRSHKIVRPACLQLPWSMTSQPLWWSYSYSHELVCMESHDVLVNDDNSLPTESNVQPFLVSYS